MTEKAMRHVFIGSSDVETEGTFKWITGGTLAWTKWYPYEPNNGDSNEDCMTIIGSAYTDFPVIHG